MWRIFGLLQRLAEKRKHIFQEAFRTSFGVLPPLDETERANILDQVRRTLFVAGWSGYSAETEWKTSGSSLVKDLPRRQSDEVSQIHLLWVLFALKTSEHWLTRYARLQRLARRAGFPCAFLQQIDKEARAKGQEGGLIIDRP